MKSYNNNRTASIPTTATEEKALALLLYFGTPYFISNAGSLLMGTEEDAKEAYSLYLDTISPDMDDEGREPLKSFEEWADETIEHVNADEIITNSGLNVCIESDQEPCKNVIDTQVINNTTYYICKRENVTNNADDENTAPSEIEKAIKLLQANDYFVHNKKEDEDVMIVLNVYSNQFPALFLHEIEKLELYTYMDTSNGLEEHLFSMEHLWEEWNEGAFELNDEEKTALERIDAEMREKGCGYFRVIA